MFGFLSFSVAPAVNPTVTIQRDSFGVPLIVASDRTEAFRGMGRAIAQDRLWQLEMSRRSSRAQLAEVLGESALRSDREVAKRLYTDSEMMDQFEKLPSDVRMGMEAYAAGINDVIAERTAANQLPKEYAENGFEPRPWTVLDTVAIGVNLARQFGAGGAGELRNLTLLKYLDGQPCKARKLDVFDDFAWQNEPSSPTTLDPVDDPVKVKPFFPVPTRRITESQLAKMPNVNLFELAGAVAAVELPESKLLAANLGVPNKMGSYAVAVAGSRSKTGNALLLGAPQMGHSLPSIVHEMAVKAPGFEVVGMNVPGVPGILIGSNANLSWTLTSGVADLEDIVVSPLDQVTKEITITIKVKGKDNVKVNQLRTEEGQVILKSTGTRSVFSLRSSMWMRELETLMATSRLATARTATDVHSAVSSVATSFNVFFATTTGDIGWRYAGGVPIRAEGIDPRLPVLASESKWQGLIPAYQMPHVTNPKSGLIYNWNNKPAAWWPNLDTPVWGSIFRSEALGRAIPSRSLLTSDLEKAAWQIARYDDETLACFMPMIQEAMRGQKIGAAERQILAWDGWTLDGSVGRTIYQEFVKEFRKELFRPHVGNLTSEALFERAIQPSLILKAANGRTRYDYLAGRKRNDLIVSALKKVVDRLTETKGANPLTWGFPAWGFRVPGQPLIPYSNRGTTIQVTELGANPFVRSVITPGISESGDHASDQSYLARAWTFKALPRPWE